MDIEVAFATPNKQINISLKLSEAICVKEAIARSKIMNQFSNMDLAQMKVGIYGKICKLDQLVTDGDRIEIYRPLLFNPMDARRNRALKD